MMFNVFSIQDLQRIAVTGDVEVLAELGRRVINLSFCSESGNFCEHEIKLIELQSDLDNEIPPDCPHCGKWLTDK